MESHQMNRRQFISAGTSAAALGAASKITLLSPRPIQAGPNPVAPSDRVRFASIGTGVEGCTIMQAALRCPGTEIVAACDLYDGRLTAAKEYGKKEIFTNKAYRAILDRKDVDAVLIATPDHWHAKITQDACAAGKDVYCEKPMSHTVEQAFAMVDAMQNHKRVVQVGSQCRSSIVYARAK